jgi:DNA invertase Pin-like site-specific DNA recombinase
MGQYGSSNARGGFCMNGQQHLKVKASHLEREAYLYVRRATPEQVSQHTQRLQPQYNLKQQALVLGWPAERVVVIDSDMGHSGTSVTDRPGFQELVRQVRRGCVGVVMALDPSRLTRNFVDWCCLLDTCVMNNTLLLDQDGLYDPADSDDRLLLECDQTMPAWKTVELKPLTQGARI